jgi:hypothetical protein
MLMRRAHETFMARLRDVLEKLAGLAFEEAYRRRPDIRLHQDYDGSHPTLLGTLLAAHTVYAALHARSPTGNAYDFHGAIHAEDAAFPQQAAVDTVRKFFGR